jgi:hypothetical protein
MRNKQLYGTALYISCVQPVGRVWNSVREYTWSSTHASHTFDAQWKKLLVSPLTLHNFTTQFCSTKKSKLTDVINKFSPLSTALIISPMLEKEINLLIGHGG